MQKKAYDQYMYSYPHKKAYFPLERELIETSLKGIAGQNITLYLHIPFCSGKCGYCNLFSVAGGRQKTDAYVAALCRQAAQYGALIGGKKNTISSVVIGGGTPFFLEIPQLEKLFAGLEAGFGIDIKKTGFDIETSPRDTTEEKLWYLKEKGLQRISMGIQSLKDEELRTIMRGHNVSSCLRAAEEIKKAKPSCVNLDLIYGIPGQTAFSFLESLTKALAYEPDELFLYPLYVRTGTPLYGHIETDGGFQYELYLAGRKYLSEQGYFQTSMRRFVKRLPGEERSCGFETMVGIGCGGRSYVENVHFSEPYEVKPSACTQILNRYLEKDDFLEGMIGCILDEDEQMRRFVIKNLGYYRGLSVAEFQEIFHKEIGQVYREELSELLKEGCLLMDRERICLSQDGMGRSDGILARFISPAVAGRMGR